MSAGELINAWPLNSCDSSTWLSSVRWGVHYAHVANKNAWQLGPGFSYRPGDERDGEKVHVKSRRFCGYNAAFASRMMRVIAAEQTAALGVDVGLFQP